MGMLVAVGVPVLLGAGALAVASACLGISSAVGMVKGAVLLKKSDKISKKLQKDCAEVQKQVTPIYLSLRVARPLTAGQMRMLKAYAGTPGSPKVFCELSDSLRESIWKLD